MSRPKIVCLCGSTRFYAEFQAANYRETLAGHIVLSVGFFGHTAGQAHGQSVGVADEATKERLDELHLHKIDLADEVLVINVGGYIGQSTKREIGYARSINKPIRFLENDEALQSGSTQTPNVYQDCDTARDQLVHEQQTNGTPVHRRTLYATQEAQRDDQ